jgi:hypothetical protein
VRLNFCRISEFWRDFEPNSTHQNRFQKIIIKTTRTNWNPQNFRAAKPKLWKNRNESPFCPLDLWFSCPEPLDFFSRVSKNYKGQKHSNLPVALEVPIICQKFHYTVVSAISNSNSNWVLVNRRLYETVCTGRFDPPFEEKCVPELKSGNTDTSLVKVYPKPNVHQDKFLENQCQDFG